MESNCNKALRVIEKLQKAIVTTIDREIDPTIKEIRDKLPETYSNLDHSRDKFVSNLNNSVSKEIERFKTDFFNIHSGIDKLGLFSSIASLVFGLFNFWNLVGWASIGLGLTGLVKSVWSWFSSDYKKSQQKKEVDKNLNEVCEKIEEQIRNQIEDAKKGICEKVENLKARLNNSVVCYERMREGLIKAGEGLWQIDNNIKTRIAQ